jgi:hypothetical protein
MAVYEQELTGKYAIYRGDSCEVLPTIADDSIHLSIYSPPFATEMGNCLFSYSSSDRDLSNCRSYDEFLEHYEFIVEQIARVTMPGRISAVHCIDVPKSGANIDGYTDFPGAIIRLHEKHGFDYLPRICIWKEPLWVRTRTMLRALRHCQVVEDGTQTNVAGSDYLIPFRKKGTNPIPVAHPTGLLRYAGADEPPSDILRYRGWKGDQKENRFSHWVWRRYASSFWDDIRGNQGTGEQTSGILPFKEAEDDTDEQHPHPLQLDVIERACVLWSNPGETVLTPFMGVGSEVYGAVVNDRLGVGIELKESYYRQAVRNLSNATIQPEERMLPF